MKTNLKIISFIGLLFTIAPAFLHFYNIVEFEQHKWITFSGTIVYLSTAPFWMNKKKVK